MDYNLLMKQRGNALFLILIAIALFAALSYAITQSGRGSGGGISREQNIIIAARIMEVSNTLRAATTRLRISGVKTADIKFNSGTWTEACTETDGTCLFTPEGGGATFPVVGRDIPTEAYDPAHLGDALNVYVPEPGDNGTCAIQGAGGPGPDGALTLMGLRREVCEAINKGLGITGIPAIDVTEMQTTIGDGYYTCNVLGGHTSGCADFSDFFGEEVYLYFSAIADN